MFNFLILTTPKPCDNLSPSRPKCRCMNQELFKIISTMCCHAVLLCHAPRHAGLESTMDSLQLLSAEQEGVQLAEIT